MSFWNYLIDLIKVEIKRFQEILSSLISDFQWFHFNSCILKSKNSYYLRKLNISSDTSVWIEHKSDCSSHCFCSDVSSEFDFNLTSMSMGCHYFSPADSISCIIYCVFYFVNICNSFSLVPSCTSFIITVLYSDKCLVFLLWHSWSYKSSEYSFRVESNWLRFFEHFLLGCFYFFCHYLFL